MSDVAWDLPTRRGPSIQRLYCQWARELSFQDSDSRLPIGRAVENFDMDCYRRNSWLISREYVLYV